MGLHLQKVRVPDDLGTAVVQIVVFRGDLINVDRTEDGHGDEALIYDRSSGDFFFRIRTLLDPLLEDLAGNKGILRHRADGLAGAAEILEELLDRGAVVS